MAKRFTDSRKWFDPWFTTLPNSYRALWLYILDTCDHAGIWKVDFRLANFLTNESTDKTEAIRIYGDRVDVLSDEKWFIKKFIEFQYGELNPSVRLHASVINTLRQHGVKKGVQGRVTKGLGRGLITPKDKDKDKVSKYISIANELISYWNSKEGLTHVRMMNEGRKRSLKARLSEKFFYKNWRAAIDRVAEHPFFTGQRETKDGSTYNATIEWFLRPEQIDKIMEWKVNSKNEVDDLCEQVTKSAKEYARR
jgi:hypothetical protein